MRPTNTPAPDDQLEPLTPPEHADDRSTYAHRQLIGWSGLLLAPLLLLFAWWRPADSGASWAHLDSISCYYYSGATVVFTGTLSALAFFLITYRGYGQRQWLDLVTTYIAGIAAALVAIFPCSPTNGFVEPPWWSEGMGTVHNISATVLFCSFAFFSLYLFTRGTSTEAASQRRRWIYYGCGTLILMALIWAWMQGRADRPIFLPESLALVAFATSWLVKGRADHMPGAVYRNLRRAPRRFIRKVLLGN